MKHIPIGEIGIQVIDEEMKAYLGNCGYVRECHSWEMHTEVLGEKGMIYVTKPQVARR